MKPTNQASLKSSVVPVLPAAGQPMFACVPVPLLDVRLEDLGDLEATASENTRCRFGLPRFSDLPSGNFTFVIAFGSLRMPPDDSVA